MTELADVRATIERLRDKEIKLPSYFASWVYVDNATVENGVVYLRVKAGGGALSELWLEPDEVQGIEIKDAIELVPPNHLFLLIESARIRLAYAFDPYFAVSLAGIQALPHQLEAVYMHMLPQVRLRYLLADDPGAGKTIMAGLLIKELKLRNSLDRILILCPASLTLQWQDELRTKFDETYEIINSSVSRNQLASNAWDRFPHVITSLDFAKQEHIRADILRVPWDLVVIDEAHKCSAHTYKDKIDKTQRYVLAEQLSDRADRLLMLTATPHQGNANQFGNLLKLLDPDQFGTPQMASQLIQHEDNPFFLRRTKENLRDFEGRKLFTERHAVTQPFKLTDPEATLYEAVTQYINEFLPRATDKRQTSVSLARIVLQRRLASSLRAIRRSLDNRRKRLSDLLQELQWLPEKERIRRLDAQRLIPGLDQEQDEGDLDEQTRQELEVLTVVGRLEGLQKEIAAMDELIHLARRTESLGEESKLRALSDCLRRAEFSDLKDGRGKLLIFTEHRDTLDYLRGYLEQWGYTTTTIHGGMDAQERKVAQDDFRQRAQICVATEAAGEGINLQFCHLMINYDLPWNPMRLEQRMGRIHRIGQQKDVYVFNFVATNTIEGQVLERLLDKLDEMRGVLGDRVFDVVGEILRLNDVRLEEILRDAVYSPKSIDEYRHQIERIDPSKLQQYEAATGVALAQSSVDLSKIRLGDLYHEERRLMPEYVERFFLAMADILMISVERRSDGLLRIEHVPIRLRQPALQAARHYGIPDSHYPKLTFRKEDLLAEVSADAVLLSPGHPLFASMVDDLEQKLQDSNGRSACFVDPTAKEPYRLHFVQVQILGGQPLEGTGLHTGSREGRTVVLQERLVAVREHANGAREVAPPDIMHDLTPGTDAGGRGEPVSSSPTPSDIQMLQRWVQAYVQKPELGELRLQREREVAIRQKYLEQSFEQIISAAEQRAMHLQIRVQSGEEAAKLARDQAVRKATDLKEKRERKLEDLAHYRLLRPGAVAYRGTALVSPIQGKGLVDLAQRDDRIEDLAMQHVMEYERRSGWEPFDISRARDGSGFDIRSLGPLDDDGVRSVRRIEVKGRAGNNQDVMLTPNEWLQANRHGDSYWLYVVWDCATDDPSLHTIQNPAQVLAGAIEELIEVKGYRVPAAAVTGLADA